MLRDGDHAGLVAILFLFAVVWATDILAYFVGRARWRAQARAVDFAGKTWSGAVGGALGGLLAGWRLRRDRAGPACGPARSRCLLAVVSQIGDLFELFVKRRNGVKDSSHIIPGHGGVMDRVDGLVAAAFALYVIGCVFGSADNPASGLVRRLTVAADTDSAYPPATDLPVLRRN